MNVDTDNIQKSQSTQYLQQNSQNFNKFAKFYEAAKIPMDGIQLNSKQEESIENCDDFKYYSTTDFNEMYANKYKLDKNSDLKIINLNIRGIERNYDNLVNYLATIEPQFDVICLTECHISNNKLLKEDLQNKYPINN